MHQISDDAVFFYHLVEFLLFVLAAILDLESEKPKIISPQVSEEKILILFLMI